MNHKTIREIILGIAAIILIWMIAAPLMCASGALTHLDGQIGQIDHSNLWNALNPIAGSIYTIGDFLCHQMESRTFMLNGNEMPFCTRDVSLLVGFIIGLLLIIVYNMKRSKTTDTYIVCSFALIILDWFMQHICNSNVVLTRVITGLLAGAAIAMFLCFVADYLRNPDRSC